MVDSAEGELTVIDVDESVGFIVKELALHAARRPDSLIFSVPNGLIGFSPGAIQGSTFTAGSGPR